MTDPFASADGSSEARVAELYDTVRRSLHYGRVSEAQTAAAELLKTQPKSTDAHELMGDVLLARGMRAEARSEYKMAMELEPANADAERKFAQATLLIGESERLRNLVIGGDIESAQAMTRKDSRGAMMRSLLFPGIGQLYKGDVEKGAIMALVALPLCGIALWGFVGFLSAMLPRIGEPMTAGQTLLALIGILGYAGVWVWSLWDVRAD